MPKTYLIHGKEVELYSIGELAEMLDRERQTIRKWERAGIIPAATFRTKSGRRLYTKEQVEAIVKAVEEFDVRQGVAIPQEFVQRVHEEFKKAEKKYVQ